MDSASRTARIANELPVSEVMNDDVWAVHIDCAARVALETFALAEQDHLVVADLHGGCHGVVSLEQVQRSIRQSGPRPVTVGECVTSECQLGADVAVATAISLMLMERVDALPVVDADRRAIGVVTWSGLVRLASGSRSMPTQRPG